MIDALEWTWTDGWILGALYLSGGNNGCLLHNIIAAADGTNHAIPTRQELSESLSKFVSCELITISEDLYVISSAYFPKINQAIQGKGGLFNVPNIAQKWLNRSKLTIKKCQQIELSAEEVNNAYKKYISQIKAPKT